MPHAALAGRAKRRFGITLGGIGKSARAVKCAPLAAGLVKFVSVRRAVARRPLTGLDLYPPAVRGVMKQVPGIQQRDQHVGIQQINHALRLF